MNDIIAIANTPQELIEVGDSLVLKNRYGMGTGIFHITVIKAEKKNGYLYITYNDVYMKQPRTLQINETMTIIKILTPNGKDYICQWEAE